MADISNNKVALFSEGSGEKTVLYRVRKADTADTLDVAADFAEIKAATFIAAGPLSGVGTVSATGTVLTLTLATMSDDTIYLLVVGQAAVA